MAQGKRTDAVADPRYPTLERKKRRIRIKGQSRVNVVRGNAPSGASTGPRQGSPEQVVAAAIRSGHHRPFAVNAIRRVGSGWWGGHVLGGKRK